MTQDILAIIPARGGSKRIPKKNIKLLRGKPLIAYTIDAATQSKELDDFIVSTEDKEIDRIVKKFGARVVKRPKELATDWAKTIDVFLDVLRIENPDVVVCLQPTSPFRTAEDIDGAIKTFKKGKCESVISVYEAEPNHTWLMKIKDKYLKPVFGNKYLKARSQDLAKMYIPNGAIYITTPDLLRKYKSFYTSKILPYVMPIERSIDIDTIGDWKKAEQILKQ